MNIQHTKTLAFAIAAMLGVCGSVWAAPVDSNDVARAMGNWRHRGGTLGTKMGEKVRDVRKVTNGEKSVYIVRFKGGGHLIAPTDTEIRPVIMFSGADDFDPDPNNPAWDLIGGNPRPVKLASAAPMSGDDSERDTDESPSAAKNRALWAELLNDENDNEADRSEYSVDEVRVAPLTTTIWAQSESKDGESGYYGTEPCFNYYTPSNYPCGCVSTAAAQILRKFSYMGPNAYEGTFTNPYTEVNNVDTPLTTRGAPYDWANMPDVPKSETERKAVGRLTSDIGIMIGTDYGADGSSSITYMAKLVFEKFFGYSSAMAMRGGSPCTGKGDLFERMFVSNFDAKLPVQIRISGHSIVGDGYGYTGGVIHYHLNFGWGWGGYWYNTPDDLIKEGDNYTGFIGAVYNIYTNQNYSAETVIASGRVTRNGQAVAGLRVSAATTDDPETEVASATTDEKGIYALFVPAGEYRVTAVAEQGERYEISGETIAHPLPCVSTIPVTNGHYNYIEPDEAEVGNAAHCDITLGTVLYEPEAEVTVGEVSGQTNFTCATIPVTAKVVHYGQTATSAKVVVTVSPVDGGAVVSKEFAISGDFDAHEFLAAFEGLTAGEKYAVTAQVVMNTDESAGLGNCSFAEAREFVWFDESATSFTAAKWSGAPVEVADGKLSIQCPTGSTMFTPVATNATSVRIVINVCRCGHYKRGMIPDSDGLAAVSAALNENGQTELFVWGEGAWHATGFQLLEEDANFDVSVDLDFLGHSVRYGVENVTLGTFALPDATGVSFVSFKGDLVMSELSGAAKDANLVRDANGTEYATVAAAKASSGAVGPFEPLWLSTWPVGDVAGSFTVRDPDGLVTPENGMTVVKRVDKGNGVFENWYAKLGAGDTTDDAAKYIQTTVDLGLAKAITDDSVVKIDEYLVANGEMSFVVKVGDETVARETVKNLVEVRATMEDGNWTKPSDGEIDFKNGKVIVTPNKGGASGFARVKIPAS